MALKRDKIKAKRHTALEDILNLNIIQYLKPMASGYATFHVAVGLFGRALSSQILTLNSIIIPNGLEKATCTSRLVLW